MTPNVIMVALNGIPFLFKCKSPFGAILWWLRAYRERMVAYKPLFAQERAPAIMKKLKICAMRLNP